MTQEETEIGLHLPSAPDLCHTLEVTELIINQCYCCSQARHVHDIQVKKYKRASTPCMLPGHQLPSPGADSGSVWLLPSQRHSTCPCEAPMQLDVCRRHRLELSKWGREVPELVWLHIREPQKQDLGQRRGGIFSKERKTAPNGK